MSLPAPVRVHPLIKLARWSLLVSGVFYGSSRQSYLAAREVGIREEEHRLRVIREAKLKEEKRIASEKDIAMLAALGDPVPK